MDLDLRKRPQQVYKKACYISECCGYITSLEKGIKDKSRDRIEIFGEDCADSLEVVNIIYFENDKIDRVQKCVYLIGFEGKGETFKSWKQLKQVFDFVDNNFIETFNARELKIEMRKEYI